MLLQYYIQIIYYVNWYINIFLKVFELHKQKK